MQRKTRIRFKLKGTRQIMILAGFIMMALILVLPAAAMPASQAVTTVDFSATAPTSYGGAQDATCTTGATVLDAGATLQLVGNCWKQVAFNYTVTRTPFSNLISKAVFRVKFMV